MRPGLRVAGVAGAVAGAVAAGVAAGVTAEQRAVRRRRSRPDSHAREPFGTLHVPARTVLADDGVPLAVEDVGDASAPLTVVFVHGFTLSMDCWHYQRRDLTDLGHLVFYDQRSHGASGRGPREHATIEQLGRDLQSVLAATAPRGPVVLVGHSMGGMAVMALADRRPDLFGSRIVGVALIGTAPGAVAETLFGLPAVFNRFVRPVAPGVIRAMDRRAAALEQGRRHGSDLAYLLTSYMSFGSTPSPAHVALMERMVSATPMEVITEFFPTFVDHDKLAALEVLNGVETLVLCGSRDRITPASHSRAIARAVVGAELVLLADAGHMVMLERPALVNLHLRALVQRATQGQSRSAVSA